MSLDSSYKLVQKVNMEEIFLSSICFKKLMSNR